MCPGVESIPGDDTRPALLRAYALKPFRPHAAVPGPLPEFNNGFSLVLSPPPPLIPEVVPFFRPAASVSDPTAMRSRTVRRRVTVTCAFVSRKINILDKIYIRVIRRVFVVSQIRFAKKKKPDRTRVGGRNGG